MGRFNLKPLMALLDVEGETVNKIEKEIEHVWFGLVDLQDVENLARMPYVNKMLQEQFQGTMEFDRANPSVKTTLRIRRVNREGCVLTRKTRTDQMEGTFENSIEISDEIFQFMMHVFGTGIMKMRYEIKPAAFDKKLQLDVFYDKFGKPMTSDSEGRYAYAKYDYEVTSADEPVPELPIPLIDMKYLNPFDLESVVESAAKLRTFMQDRGFRI